MKFVRLSVSARPEERQRRFADGTQANAKFVILFQNVDHVFAIKMGVDVYYRLHAFSVMLCHDNPA